MTLARHALPLALAAVAASTLTGCVKRRIRVTSDPPGALVYLNDVQIGRTPAEASFKFYGWYDLRLELDGFETVTEGRKARAPWYEYPGPDLVATVLPFDFENVVTWHVDLVPTPAAAGVDPVERRETLIDRATRVRDLTLPPRDP